MSDIWALRDDTILEKFPPSDHKRLENITANFPTDWQSN